MFATCSALVNGTFEIIGLGGVATAFGGSSVALGDGTSGIKPAGVSPEATQCGSVADEAAFGLGDAVVLCLDVLGDEAGPGSNGSVPAFA